jgi:hypothetical protein
MFNMGCCQSKLPPPSPEDSRINHSPPNVDPSTTTIKMGDISSNSDAATAATNSYLTPFTVVQRQPSSSINSSSESSFRTAATLVNSNSLQQQQHQQQISTIQFLHANPDSVPTGIETLIKLSTSPQDRAPYDYVVLNTEPEWCSPPAFFNNGNKESIKVISIPHPGTWYLIYFAKDQVKAVCKFTAVESKPTIVPIRISSLPTPVNGGAGEGGADAIFGAPGNVISYGVPRATIKNFKLASHIPIPLRNPGTGFMNTIQTYTDQFEQTKPQLSNNFQAPPSEPNGADQEAEGGSSTIATDPCIWWIIAFNNNEAEMDILPDGLMAQIESVLRDLSDRGQQAFIRFFYTKPHSDSLASDYQDPRSIQRVISHISQLGTLLKRHRRSIAGINAGMLGAFGEWHHSNLGELHEIPSEVRDIGDLNHVEYRRLDYYFKVVEAWFTWFPEREDPPIQVRRHFYKKLIIWKLYEQLTTSVALASQQQQAQQTINIWNTRLSSHLDALLSSDDDMGTYMDPSEQLVEYKTGRMFNLRGMRERMEQEQDAEFNPVIGETCIGSNPRLGGGVALEEFASEYSFFQLCRR